MIPTSDSFGRIIDCRTLVFDGQYFGLTESEVLGLAEACPRQRSSA